MRGKGESLSKKWQNVLKYQGCVVTANGDRVLFSCLRVISKLQKRTSTMADESSPCILFLSNGCHAWNISFSLFCRWCACLLVSTRYTLENVYMLRFKTLLCETKSDQVEITFNASPKYLWVHSRYENCPLWPPTRHCKHWASSYNQPRAFAKMRAVMALF